MDRPREGMADDSRQGRGSGARSQVGGDWALWVLLVTSWVIFMGFARPVICTNDGSTFALVTAIVRNQSFQIDRWVDLTAKTDCSWRKGHFYSDRPPGTAFLAVPFSALGRLRDRIVSPQATTTDLFPAARLAPLLAGIATIWLVYWLGLALTESKVAALVAAFTYAFGSAAWIYSSTLFIHSVAAFCVTASVALLVKIHRRSRSWDEAGACSAGERRALRQLSFLLGLVAGWGVVSDYATLVLIPIYFFFLWALAGRARQRRLVLTWWFVGLAGPALLLGGYNWACFGNPWTVGYAFNVKFPWTHDFRTTYSGRFSDGLRGLIYGFWRERGGASHATGQVRWSPVLILAVIGYVVAMTRRESRWAASLALLVSATVICLAAKHRTWWGGDTGDARYIFSVTPIWFAGLAPWIDRAVVRVRVIPARVLLGAVTVGAIALTLVLRYIWAMTVVGANVAIFPAQLANSALHRDHRLLWQCGLGGVLDDRWEVLNWSLEAGVAAAVLALAIRGIRARRGMID